MKELRWTWVPLALALPVLLSWGIHHFRGETPIEIAIVDKTVPFENRIEHRSLLWLLRHLNVVHPGGEGYDRDLDYLGAFPGPEPGDPPHETTSLDAAAIRNADLVYLVDTYGVYEGDLESGAGMLTALERSPKIYGGLEQGEVDAVASALDRGIPVVAEFNTFASPTSAAVRGRIENLLGVRWTQWIGRYFADLDDENEVPRWLVRTWEREWNAKWEFEGPAWVLTRDDVHCEVLRVGEEIESIGLTLERSEPTDPLLAQAGDGVAYPYWFDIVVPLEGTELLASYQWHLHPSGEERMRARELPLRFPAVLRHRHGPDGTPTLYFAGDFADNPMRDGAVPLAGYLGLRRWLEAIKLAPSEDSFYWRFYVPMMRELLDTVPKQG